MLLSGPQKVLLPPELTVTQLINAQSRVAEGAHPDAHAGAKPCFTVLLVWRARLQLETSDQRINLHRGEGGQWDIAKLHLQMRESANPQLSRTSPRSRPIGTYAKPDDDLTVGSALIPLIGPAYPRKQRHSTYEYSARKNCPMKASHGARASIVIAPNCGPPPSGHVKSAIHLDHLSCDEPSHL
jgi:hypothetical protein